MGLFTTGSGRTRGVTEAQVLAAFADDRARGGVGVGAGLVVPAVGASLALRDRARDAPRGGGRRSPPG